MENIAYTESEAIQDILNQKADGIGAIRINATVFCQMQNDSNSKQNFFSPTC